VRFDQLFADQDAGRVASLRCLRERDSCPDQQRLDRSHRDVERGCELQIRHSREFPHQQRGTLLFRKSADVLDQPPQGVPQVDLGERIMHGGAHQVKYLWWRRGRSAELVDAAVVRDPEQPCPERQVSL
jgi:hypothetical protein